MNCKICSTSIPDHEYDQYHGMCLTCFSQQEYAARFKALYTTTSAPSNASDAMAVPSGAVSVEAGELLAVQPKKERRKNTIRDGWIDRAYKAEFKLHEAELLIQTKSDVIGKLMTEIDAMRQLDKTANCTAWVVGSAIGAAICAAVMLFLCH